MADVVQLSAKTKAKPDTKSDHEYVWTCTDCDGQSFQLLHSGVTVCVRCAKRSDQAADKAETAWRSHLPDLPLNLEDIPPIDQHNIITDCDAKELILRRFSKAVLDEDLVAVLLVRREGGMRMWSEGCFTDEQEDWYRERVATLSDFLLSRNTEEPPDGETS